MESIKILIVEDEFIIASNLKRMLSNLGYEPLTPVYNKMNAIEKLKSGEVDLAILDINLDGKEEGIEVGTYIHENLNIPFIYLTSNSDKKTVQLARQTKPSSYLLKPFTEDDIYVAIEIAIEKEEQSNQELSPSIIPDSIFVKLGKKYVKVPIATITHIEADGKGVILYTQQGQKLQLRSSLEHMYRQLEPKGFNRIHRSFIVNLYLIQSFTTEDLQIDSFTLPISRQYREELMKKFKTLS